MLRRRDFIRIAGLSGLGLYVESALPAFGKLIENHSGDIDNLNRALSIAKSIEDRAYRARSICRVAEGFHKAGNKGMSEVLLSKALNISFEAGKRRDYALEAAGNYYLSTGDIKKVLQIIEIMDRENIMRNLLLSKTAYFAYTKGDTALTESLLCRLDPSSPLEYSGLWKSSNRPFLEYLERVYRVSRRSYYAEHLATGWFELGEMTKGFRYLEEIWNYSPHDAIKIAAKYLPKGEMTAIEERALSLGDETYRIESLLALSDYYVKTDQEKALSTIGRIIDFTGDDLSADTCGRIGRLLVRAGDKEKGRRYLYSVPDLVINHYSDMPEEDILPIFRHYLEELMVEFITAGLQDEIPRLLNDLDRKGIIYEEPLWYPGITKMAADSGCRDNALSFLEKEIERVSEKALPGRINCLSAIASSLLAQNERKKGIETARKVMNDLEALLSNRNLKSRIDFAYLSPVPYIKHSDMIFLDAVPRLSLELAEQGFTGESRELSDMVGDRRLDDAVRYHTALYLSKTGRLEEALKTAAGIRDEKQRGSAMYEVVCWMVSWGIET
jgi:hypothetical protein